MVFDENGGAGSLKLGRVLRHLRARTTDGILRLPLRADIRHRMNWFVQSGFSALEGEAPTATQSRQRKGSGRARKPQPRSNSVLIVAAKQSEYLAWVYEDAIRSLGLSCEIACPGAALETERLHILMGASAFDRVPENFIAVQLEQLGGGRPMERAYFNKLRSSLKVIDYSRSNMHVLRGLGIEPGHLTYIPIAPYRRRGGHAAGGLTQECAPFRDRPIDVLFFGDPSAPRRVEALNLLTSRLNVHTAKGIYGAELLELVGRTKVVVNIHYYEKPHLETMRLSQCFSVGTPVVSEWADDARDYPGRLATRFVGIGAWNDVVVEAEALLIREEWERQSELIETCVQASNPVLESIERVLQVVWPAALPPRDLPPSRGD